MQCAFQGQNAALRSINAYINHAGRGNCLMAAFFQVNDIMKSFGPYKALEGVSLHVDQGEMLCLLGPSGCGKTTLLRIMAGLEMPDAGCVVLEGRDITSLNPEKRQFGFVFQNYALFPNLNVGENISYGLRGYAKSHRQERVSELLALVGLKQYERHYPAELSGGQQQRVALARALAPDCKLVFMDEPLSALDARVRAQLREDLRGIQRRLGITAILVTHDQEEALAMADRIVLMQKGRIEQVDTPQALYENPSTRFAAEFIGSMNILSLERFNNGEPFGVRYEDILVSEATEANLRQEGSLVARIESIRPLGSFRRVELLLNDQITSIYADIPSALFNSSSLGKGRLVAVTMPTACWRRWS